MERQENGQGMREVITNVFDRGAVDAMRRCGIDIDAFVKGLPEPCFWYPDGSLELVGNRSCRHFEETVWSEFGAMLWKEQAHELEQWHRNASVTSLAHHSPPTETRFQIYAAWVTKLDDGSLVVRTKRNSQPVPGVDIQEEPPDRTLVTVEFVRTLRPAHVEVVRQTLRSWLATVQEQGIDGEGPVSFRGPLSLARKAVQFRLDTSQCGHRTIVWLLLNLFPISGTNPLETISLTAATGSCEGDPPVYANQTWEAACGPFDRSLDLL